MKNDIVKSRELIEQAFKALPTDNVLINARNYLFKALQEVVQVEKKRNKKTESVMTPSQKWQLDLKTSTLMNPMNPQQQKDALQALEQMIADEQKKLAEVTQKSSKLKTLLD